VDTAEPDPATRAESLSTFAMVQFLSGQPAQDLMTEAVRLEDLAMEERAKGRTPVFTASRTCHGLQLLWAGELDAAREVLHQELTEYERLGRYVVRAELLTAAIRRLEPVLAFLDEMGSPEPGIIPCVPDAIEALVSLGRLDEAEGLLDRLERRDEPSVGRGPSPAPREAGGCSPRPGAICRRPVRRWSKPCWSTGACRSPSSWPGRCW
jgi:hypothetical protein